MFTDDRVKLILGKYVDVETKKYIDKILNLSLPEHRILPWNIQNVVKYAEISNLAIIPLNVDKQMNKYKYVPRFFFFFFFKSFSRQLFSLSLRDVGKWTNDDEEAQRNML